MNAELISWEQAVVWLKGQPDKAKLVKDCYFDDPVSDAAQRFCRSAEWQATRTFFPPVQGRALDIGAGRGISSYALVMDGWGVTSLDPDMSNIVGIGATAQLARETGVRIESICAFGERMPLADETFDLVYCRQAMHHAANINLLAREIGRVLKPGGVFIAVREHVIDQQEDLPAFLREHPLHGLYGGENAYTLDAYMDALGEGNMACIRAISPIESVINYFPLSSDEVWTRCCRGLVGLVGWRMGKKLASERTLAGRVLYRLLLAVATAGDKTPGRLYSFVAKKRGKNEIVRKKDGKK